MIDRDPVGRYATVTGRVAPGELGEVTVAFASTTDTFLAVAPEDTTFDVGATVTVIRRLPGKRVLVDVL